jgi:hypothetical protein
VLITVPGDFQARFFNGVLGASRRAASQGYSTAGAGAIGRRHGQGRLVPVLHTQDELPAKFDRIVQSWDTAQGI